jgi:hypothetical protein
MNKEPYHQPLLTRHGPQRVLAAKTAGECALLLVLSGEPVGAQQLHIERVGTNIVVSWPKSYAGSWPPGSNGTYVLELSPSLTGAWRPVEVAPVTNQQTLDVTLRNVPGKWFFRLRQIQKDPSEKDPNIDKDPTEKDPVTDKSGEKGTDEKCPDGEKSPCLA